MLKGGKDMTLKPKWRSVKKEGCPENMQEVLAYSSIEGFVIAFYSGYKKEWYSESTCNYIRGVTHWTEDWFEKPEED